MKEAETVERGAVGVSPDRRSDDIQTPDKTTPSSVSAKRHLFFKVCVWIGERSEW